MNNKFKVGDIITNGTMYYLVVKAPDLFRKSYSIVNLANSTWSLSSPILYSHNCVLTNILRDVL
jgi:hypothetical protein